VLLLSTLVLLGRLTATLNNIDHPTLLALCCVSLKTNPKRVRALSDCKRLKRAVCPHSPAARRGAHGGAAHNAAAVHLAAGPTAALARALGDAAQGVAQRVGLAAVARAVALGVAVETVNRLLKPR